jgi:hypothetical protein
MNLTSDELSVLLIAANGEYMLAIGRWQPVCFSLAAKGLMKKEIINGGPQYLITPAGREAAEQEDNSRLGALIESGSRFGATQKLARDVAEEAAQKLAECGRASVQVTGDSVETAVRKWSEVVLRRALELLNG